MMSTFERLDVLMDRFARRDRNHSYRYSIEEDHDGEYYELELFEAIGRILDPAEDVTSWTYTYIGGFDSPGYDLDCYCLIVLDENNEIHTYPINIECF